MRKEAIYNPCLFCAKPCGPTVTTENGRIHRVREGLRTTNELKRDASLSFFGEEALLGKQLEAMFILKEILSIGKDDLYMFLGKLDGHLDPDLWFGMCNSCRESVTTCFEVLKQIRKLQRKWETLTDQLKVLIRDTRDSQIHAVIGSVNEEKPQAVISSIWRDIRERVPHVVATGEQTFGEPQENAGAGIVGSSLQDDSSENSEMVASALDVHDSIGGRKGKDKRKKQNRRDPPPPTKLETKKSEAKKKPPTADLSISQPQHQLTTRNTDSTPPPSMTKKKRRDLHKPEKEEDKQLVDAQAEHPGNTDDSMDMDTLQKEDGNFNVNVASNPVKKSSLKEPEPSSSIQKLITQEDLAHSSSISTPTPTSSISLTKGKPRRVFKCEECPYNSTEKFAFETHRNLHKPNSGAIPCPVCEWFLRPNQLTYHNYLHHRIIGNYEEVKTGTAKHYKCLECPFVCKPYAQIVPHLELHKPGSGAVTCTQCQWLLDPDPKNIEKHNKANHRYPSTPILSPHDPNKHYFVVLKSYEHVQEGSNRKVRMTEKVLHLCPTGATGPEEGGSGSFH